MFKRKLTTLTFDLGITRIYLHCRVGGVGLAMCAVVAATPAAANPFKDCFERIAVVTPAMGAPVLPEGAPGAIDAEAATSA